DPPDPRQRVLRWIVAALLVLGFGACLSEGADSPADPTLSEGRLESFGEVAFRIAPQPNEIECALLAATETQRARGLMEVTDLDGYPGMLFRFSQDTQAAFHMKNTPMPLSIAWFASDGSLVSAADMAPCVDADSCPVYAASAPYRYALEVPQGQLDDLGIVQGSRLEVLGGCP
ncbi:MAG TPA: DUF192 domain-containing protein, partial [Acidimicrobiales bacterium]|nr:DUF192 domain-containing protein [Acidimicrobiales bacterium]